MLFAYSFKNKKETFLLRSSGHVHWGKVKSDSYIA